MSSISTLNSYHLPKRCSPTTQRRHNNKPRTLSIVSVSDPHVLRIAETLEDSIVSNTNSPPLQKLRDVSAQTLLTTPWPSRKDEPFRFTDTSFIRNSDIQPINPVKTQSLDSLTVSGEETLLPNLVFVDGFLVDSLLNLDELPDGVFVGSLSGIVSDDLTSKVMNYLCGVEGNKDLFWSLNGVGANDVIVIYVPEGCKVERSLSLRFVSLSGSDKESKTLPISNPRILVLVENGGEISIVEEYIYGDGIESDEKCYWTNSVIEVVVGDEAKVHHSYVQRQSLGAAHVKWTSVRQESRSAYELTEVSTGGRLSRHNLHIQQLGPDTITELSTFHLSMGDQLQDLHSKLVLDHPRGYSRQLHKCIVAHPQGQAVFDGNIQVNREAQLTDAGQLTRSLLMAPRATVNVKPNLQIIADDVKCSHGAAISDLEEDQLFYFRARGIDAETARKALVFSFAAEVIERFTDTCVKKNVESVIRNLLDPAK